VADVLVRDLAFPARWARVILLLLLAIGCGPELDDPSSKNITGHWVSSDTIGALSALTVDVSQTNDGKITGEWSGLFSTRATCPPGIGSNPTGPVNGRNTALLVHFSLLGAGDFEGQQVGSTTLRGGFVSCSQVFPIEFSLRPSLQ
jgi:hypothetical protein